MKKFIFLIYISYFFNIFSMEKEYVLRDDSTVKTDPFKVMAILADVNETIFSKFFKICSNFQSDALDYTEIAFLNRLCRQHGCELFENGRIIDDVAKIVRVMVNFENEKYYFIDPIKPDCMISCVIM